MTLCQGTGLQEEEELGGGGIAGWLAGRGRMEAAALMQFLLPAAIVVELSVQLFFYCQLALNLKFNV